MGPGSRPCGLARDDRLLAMLVFLLLDFDPVLCYAAGNLFPPREVSRTSRGWGRGRWPGMWVQRRTPAPAAEAARSRSADPRATGDQWRPGRRGVIPREPVCPRSGG